VHGLHKDTYVQGHLRAGKWRGVARSGVLATTSGIGGLARATAVAASRLAGSAGGHRNLGPEAPGFIPSAASRLRARLAVRFIPEA